MAGSERQTVYVVGIAGGTGSGKTTLAQTLYRRLGADRAVLLSHDAYYRDLEHVDPAERARVNFDHPDALETELLVAHLDGMRRGEGAQVPVYDFTTHTRRKGQTVWVPPRPVVLLEGILVFSDGALRERLDFAVFVDAPADLRLIRRLRRDVQGRGRSVESVAEQYLDTVRPMHEAFVEPERMRADLIVPGDRDHSVAVEMLVAHLETVLKHAG